MRSDVTKGSYEGIFSFSFDARIVEHFIVF